MSSLIIVEFAESTKNVCMCLSIAVILIVIFMMTPLNSFLLSSIFGKVVILTLLGYTTYYNIIQTNKFADKFNISITSGSWNTIKTNIAFSYTFSFFLIVLMLSVVRKIF
jgi:hypothetical protein